MWSRDGALGPIWGARAPSRPPDRAFLDEPMTLPWCWPSSSSTPQLSELPPHRPTRSTAWALQQLLSERHAVGSINGESEGAPNPGAHMHLGSADSCLLQMPHMPTVRPSEHGTAQHERTSVCSLTLHLTVPHMSFAGTTSIAAKLAKCTAYTLYSTVDHRLGWSSREKHACISR